MGYTIENINGCTKKIIFTFDDLDLSTQINESLKEKQKSVNLKGFRKGKAPIAMVQKYYGPQLENDALNSFIQKQLSDAVMTEKIHLIGYPEFENMNYDSGSKVSFEAICEVLPSLTLKDLSSLSFTRDKVELEDNAVENNIKSTLEKKAEMKEVTDDIPLKTGHHAVLNFEGEKENGDKPEDMKGSEFLLEIGSNQFIPSFEDGMIGMKKGESKDITTTFPNTYHVEELKNAKVKFKVELLEIKEKVYPEVNDELAVEMGYDSTEDFKSKTRDQLMKQKDRAADEKLHQEILDRLIKDNEFDIPKTMIEQQKKHAQEDLKNTLQAQGFNEIMMKDYFEKWDDDIAQKAIFQVKSGLILDTLAKEYQIEVSNDEFEAKLNDMAEGTGLTKEQIKSFYAKDEQTKKNLQYAIREEKTFEKLKEKITVK